MKAKLSLSLMFFLLCAASALAAGPGQTPMQGPMSQAPMKQAPMSQAPGKGMAYGDYMTGGYGGGGYYGGGYSNCGQPMGGCGGGRRHHRHCGRRHHCHRRGC